MRKMLLGVGFCLAAIGCGGSPPPTVEIELPDYGDPYVSVSQLNAPSPIPGAMAQGVAGDWLLGNERFQVCISRGDIVDLAPRGSNDVLRRVATALGAADPREAVYGRVRVEYPDSVSVRLVATANDPRTPGLKVETAYLIKQESSVLTMETALVNTGTAAVESLAVADLVDWGRAVPFAPGAGFRPAGAFSGLDWLGGAGEGTGLVFFGPRFAGFHGAHQSTLVGMTATLAPGDTARYERSIIVASGGLSDATRTFGFPDWVPVRLQVSGSAGELVAGARVVVTDDEGAPIMAGVTDRTGVFVSLLPQGRHTVRVHDATRGDASQEVNLVFGDRAPYWSDPAVSLKATLSEPAALSLGAQADGQPVAARWIFKGIDGTPDPDFGPVYRVSGAGNVVFTPAEETVLLLPAGKYAVSCIHGLRHEMWQADLSLRPNSERHLNADLQPLPFEAGWVSADLHVHTLNTPGGTLTSADCLLAAACRGLEWLTVPDATPSALSALGTGVGLVPEAPLVGFNHEAHARPDSIWGEGSPLQEVLNGAEWDRFAQNWDGWVQALKDGKSVVGVGNSGSFNLQDGADVRNLVVVSDPGSREQILDGFRAGRVQVTNGPLIEFELEGAPVGGTVESDGNAFSGHVRVVAGSWVDVSLVEILVDGQMHAEYRIRESERPVRFDEDIELRTVHGGRSFVQVRVTGSKPLNPAIYGDEVTPIAFTNPIWVEVPFAIRARSARERAPHSDS